MPGVPLCGGEGHVERGALARPALHPRRTAVRGGDLAHYGEPDARAAPSAPGDAARLEDLEDALVVGGVDPASVIPHHEMVEAVLLRDPHLDHGAHGRTHVVQGVADEIAQDLIELG